MKTCNKCGSTNIVGVEYAYMSKNRYDGVSEWECQDCHLRIGRWSGKELKDGEEELRWGR
jgi:transposase-like protein